MGPGEMNLEQVLQKMQAKLGGDPYPMRLLNQLVPEGVMDQARSSQFVETLPAIPIKYKMLMYVTAAAALGSEYCTKIYAQRAMREGATAQALSASPSLPTMLSERGEPRKNLNPRRVVLPPRSQIAPEGRGLLIP